MAEKQEKEINLLQQNEYINMNKIKQLDKFTENLLSEIGNNNYNNQNNITNVNYNSNQYNNGYRAPGIYWFKYESLKWRVLDPSTGLVMCDGIIDCRPFNSFNLKDGYDEIGCPMIWGNPEKTYATNDYEHSEIRAWLRMSRRI